MAKSKPTSNETPVSASSIGGTSSSLNTDNQTSVKEATQVLAETKKSQTKSKPTASGNTEVVKTVARKTPPKTLDVKLEKTQKLRMERDSFTMPKAEYAQLHILKERLAVLSQPVKKSELLRAGIMHLAAMNDVALKAALSLVPTIKTGRPKKK